MFFCDGLKLLIPFIAKFSYQGLLYKFVNGHFKLLAQTASRVTDVPLVVIYGRYLGIFPHPNRIQVTGYRFFPGHHPRLLGYFNASLGNPAVKNHIGAFPTIYERRFPFSIGSFYMGSLCFYGLDTFGPEIGPDIRINRMEHLGFLLLQGSSATSLDTAGPFAGAQVTDKGFFKDFFRHQGPADLKHAIRFLDTESKDMECPF